MKNYKLSCVGVDNEGAGARLLFCVYNVEGTINAERIVRKRSYRRSLMRKHNIDWRNITFNIVEIDEKGETLSEFIDAEQDIRLAEDIQIKEKKKKFHRKAREKYWKDLEKK